MGKDEVDREKSLEERDSEMYVRNAKDLLAGFEDESVGVKKDVLNNAISELQYARRSLSED